MANGSAGGGSATRVSYREQQVVSRGDLTAEQAYLIAARRRHNIGPHAWGIVSGLEVTVTAGVVSVAAGAAIDGYGRELILTDAFDVPPSAVLELNADQVALWLAYEQGDYVVPLGGEWRCGPGDENRTFERATLRLTTVDPGADLDPRQPPDVVTGDRDFPPERGAPDDPATLWPVFLGVVQRDAPTAPWQLNTLYEARRPYAGLRGQTITAPSGIARVRVGHEVEGDNRAFAVETIAGATTTERLGIDLNGHVFLDEKTTVTPVAGANPVDGNLLIQRAAPDVTAIRRAGLAGCQEASDDSHPRFWGVQFDRIPPPEVATPWHIYHAGVPALPPPTAPAEPFDELRVEFLDPGKKANRKGNRFVIGKRDSDGKFVRCVTIDAECTVTINGPLQVNKQIVMGALQADPFDARLHSLLVGGWLQGLLANTHQLASYYDARVALAMTGPAQAFVDVPFTFNLHVVNTGRVALSGVTVSETHNLSTATATLPAAFALDPNESKDVTVSFTVTGPGHFTCQMTVTALAQGAAYQINVTSAGALDVVHRARIESDVHAAKTHAVVGETVAYDATVRNDGDAALTRVFFTTAETKDAVVTSRDRMSDEFLQVGQRRSFTGSVQRADAGTVVISAPAGGSAAGISNDSTDTAQETVTFHEPAQINVTIVGLSTGSSNTPMNFTVRVTNTGTEAVSLQHVTLAKDAAFPNGVFDPIAQSGLIPPGEDLDLSARFTPGQVTATTDLDITADVGVTGPGGDVVTDNDTEHTTVH